jgi:hypothetical protein
MSAGNYDLYIERYSTWTIEIQIKDKTTGLPIDLTDREIFCNIRSEANGPIIAQPKTIITDAINGKFNLELTAADTAAFPLYGRSYSEATSYVYDVIVKKGDSIMRLINGKAVVSPGITI